MSHLKVGLANAFLQQGKNHLAVVILEVLDEAIPRHRPCLSALCPIAGLQAGEVEEAVRHYHRGVDDDPSAADRDFAERIGIRIPEESDDEFDPETSEVVEGRVRSAWSEPEPARRIEVDRPSLIFADVGGMDSVKEEIRIKIIHPMNHPDLYRRTARPIGGGILLYGPPGCGKTYLAARRRRDRCGVPRRRDRRRAGDVDRQQRAESARAVRPGPREHTMRPVLRRGRRPRRQSGRPPRQRRAAAHQPVPGRAGWDRRPNEGVLVLAATNAPWHLDPAFRRPGRFDRILFVPPPDVQARAAILRLSAGVSRCKISITASRQEDRPFLGPTSRAVVDLAVEAKLREAMKAGVPQPLTTKDLLTAAATIKPSTREWFATARNYALYSNQGGIYDDILKHLKLG